MYQRITWDPTYPLGRHIRHDPQSRNFPARTGEEIKTRLWSHRAPVLDQGSLGSCTGNALAQWFNTSQAYKVRRKHYPSYLTEDNAVEFYSLATSLDPYEGTYPPDDTGSDGLSLMKAGMQLGLFSRYDWTFSFDHFLGALQLSPVLVGTYWYDSMFSPNAKGFVTVSGSIAGGHEYLCIGCNVTSKHLTFLNSWGPNWGTRGRFRVSFDDFKRLLAEEGDAVAPVGAL